MRELNMSEMDQISGAADFWFDIKVFGGSFSSGEVASLYESAVSSMTDFFMWWDPEELLCTGS